jgi:hypothetical protein
MDVLTRRGIALLAVLLGTGLVTGFGASWVLGENPRGDGTAAPVAAASPSLPVDPVPELLRDPAYPTLEPDIELVPAEVGSGDSRMTLPVPRGWDLSQLSPSEWQWRPPGQPSFGHVMRVEQVLGNRRSIDWTLDRRIDELYEDERNVKILGQEDGRLHVTYVASNHLRSAYFTWLDLTGSDDAQVEIALAGRAQDAAGMADLIGRVATGIRLGGT